MQGFSNKKLYAHSIRKSTCFVKNSSINHNLKLIKNKIAESNDKEGTVTILFGVEGETRQGVALSLLRKIPLYVRAPLPDGKPSHMDEEFSSLHKT